MRQSLLFGGSSRAGAGRDETETSTSADAVAAPPAKKLRRAAASKSEESSKRQMQMQMTQDGKLHRKEEKRTIAPPVRETVDKDDVQHVATKKAKRPALKAQTPPPPSIVKGTLTDASQAHSFFAKRQPAPMREENDSVVISNGLSKLAKQKWPQQREAPWPTSESVHVQPDDAVSRLSSRGVRNHSLNRRRQRSSTKDKSEVLYPWSAGPSSRPEAKSRKIRRDVEEINGKEHEACESSQEDAVPLATQRIRTEISKGARTNSDTLWVDRWRPVRADQVLGNEIRAIYLRDWLKELEVTAEVKAGKVIKRVEKRKKKPKEDNLDGFIVDDEEEEEAWFDHFRKPKLGEVETGEEEMNCNMEERREGLMNAIVLQGPTGSGKTAAVYACAAELGFEVFEIYPGSGRRSGKDISHAVGNLGRNHMVSSGGIGGGATWKGSKVVKTLAKVDNPRQSLILLEEVDLLYEDDKGFWPSVVDLVSTSKRPIVMTCNDSACIPYGILPIQDVLAFEPPSEAQAGSYLRAMAMCDGYRLPERLEKTMYYQTAGEQRLQDIVSQWTTPTSGPLNSGTSLASVDKSQAMRSSLDLRQAIMQLQYFCTGNLTDGSADADLLLKPTAKPSNRLRTEIIQAEDRSFCDALLNRPFNRASELQEPDEYEASINDVQTQGATVLCKVQVKMEVTTLAMLGREEDYQRAILEDQCLASYDSQDYDQRRWKESKRVSQLMNSLMVSEHLRIPSWVPVVEIAPLVSNMVSVDDNEQATYQARLDRVLQDIKESHDAGGSDSLKAASNSLLEMGIRPSRHKMRILLARNGEGTLALSRQESQPYRWFELDNAVLQLIRDSNLAM